MRSRSNAITHVVLAAIALASAGALACHGSAPKGGVPAASAQREGGLQNDEIARFSSFPLFWLGDSFDGLELTYVDEVNRPALLASPAEHSVTFIYGSCEPTSEASCPAPIQITIYGTCGPELAPRVAKAAPPVRGARATKASSPGQLYLESEYSKIMIIATTGSDLDAKAAEIADSLVGANSIVDSVRAGAKFDSVDRAGLAPDECS